MKQRHMLSRLAVAAATMWTIALFGATTSPLPIESVKLTGYLADRHGRNLAYLRCLHDETHPWREKIKGQTQDDSRIGRDFMLDPFRRRSEPRPRDWQGEYAGKWMDAAALMVGNTGDRDLAAALEKMARALIESQTADGYLGIDLPEQRGRAWDVWNIWYSLTGLLSEYEFRGRAASLEAARRGGDYLTRNYLPPHPKFDVFRGAWKGGCTVDVLDQVVRLYHHTKQPDLLKLAAHISANYPPLQTMRASGKASPTHVYVLCAYLGGQVLHAQAVNRPEELSWVESVWEDLVRHHVYPTFSLGKGEQLRDTPISDSDGDRIQETCATVEWLLLNHRLYQATGKARYAHMMENIIYNALLAAQSLDGMKWTYYTPMTRTAGGKPWFVGPTMCCYWSGPRGIACLPQMTYHLDEQGARVDLFEDSSTQFVHNGQAITLQQHTTYPADGSSQFTIKMVKPAAFALRIRIPEWANNVQITLNGQPVKAVVPGQYAVIERVWTDGDTVSVRFEMTTTILPMPDGAVAVRRGPEVLSVDARDNPGLDLNKIALSAGRKHVESFAPDGLRRRYSLTMLVNNQPQSVVLTPFAAAGNSEAGYRTTFPNAPRPFLMALTPTNFDETEQGTRQMKELMAKHAEVVAVYLDYGVPWPEVAEGKPFHKNVQKEISILKQRISPRHKVFLALNAGAFDRRNMAGYWGEKVMMPRPGKWADKTLDDPEIIETFIKYCERMIEEFRPSFLAYAIEINMMAGAEPKRFEQFMTLAERVHPRLKAKHKEILIFPTFQIDFGGEQVIRRLMPHSDAIAISTYPHIRGLSPATLPSGWLADVRKLAPDKPFIVAETGFPAAPFAGKWLFDRKVRVDATPPMQAEYLRWMLAEARRLDARLFNWFFPHDINAYLEGQKKLHGVANEMVAVADMAMNLGLMDGNRQPRPALDVWIQCRQQKHK